jgi:hypothetical protein
MSQVIESSSVFHQAHLKRVHQEIAPRSFYSKASETFLFFLNAGSLTRNSMSAGGIWKGAAAAARVAPAVGGLAIAGGAMALIRGGEILKAGLSGLRTAYNRDNWEGGVFQSTTAIVGGSYAIAGAGMITAQSAALASAATATAVGTILFTGGAFGLYGALGIYAGYALAINHQFRHNLNKILESPGNEAEKVASALQWIHDRVGSGKNETELNKKWDQFASRTSEACCRYARQHITPDFIEKVRSGDTKTLRHAKWIIQEVKRANGKQIAIHWLLMTICAIGLAGIVLGMLFASGPLAPLLFAICAGLWFLFDTSKLKEQFGNFFFGASQIPRPAI